MFPIWFLQVVVLAAVVLCGLGAIALIAFLVIDTNEKQIW